MSEPVLVVLAAGMGSRYGGLKQIEAVDAFGHIIIDYSIYDAIRAGFREVVFIIKKEIEKDFKSIIDPHLRGKNIDVKYAYQELDCLPPGYSVPAGRKKPWGTAHAIACLDGIVDSPFAVINADDYYGSDAFKRIFVFLEKCCDKQKNNYAMVGYRLENTLSKAGTVSRGICKSDGDMLREIWERRGIFTHNGNIYYNEGGKDQSLDPDTLVSMNLWGFTPSFVNECKKRFPVFLDESLYKDPDGCEFLLPSVVSDLIDKGTADVRIFLSEDKWHGITYKEDKNSVVMAFKDMTTRGFYPENF